MAIPPADEGMTGPVGDGVFDQRDWLRVTLACIGDGVITTDVTGRVNYLNPVAERLTGWSLAEAAGVAIERVFLIINETTRVPAEQPVGKVIERGQTVGLGNHTLLISRDGSERPIDDSAAVIRDRGGNVVGVVLVFHDITERRHGERLIDSARTYAESIVATVRGPLLALDRELHVRTANRSFYETFAVTPPEVIGRFIYDLGDGQWDIPALRTLLEDIVPASSSFEGYEVEHDFEHIGPKTMLLNARRFPPGGEYELLLLAIEDITDRKRLAASVATSEVRYRRLFEAARDGILLVDPDTRRITDANPFMVELLGYPRDQLVGKELWEIGLLKDEQASREAFGELQRAGTIRYEDLPLQSASGARREVEFVSNIYQENGHRVSQCNIRDITDRKRLEAERERLRRVAEEARARSEANEAKLAEADRRKDEFIAILAHELRNPLSSIGMAAHLLQRPGTEKDREWNLGVIAHQVAALNRLIEDLLDVSRISKGKVHLRREPLELATVIGHAVDSVAALVRERGHELAVSLPPGPMTVDGDPTRLEQVFVNLLTNAAKYTAKGGRISLTASEEGQGFLVQVRDNGEGIASEMLPRLFEMFTQVESSILRSRGGLGIGLSLVKDLVEMHGGTVTAASDGVGKGSRFVVQLPASAP